MMRLVGKRLLRADQEIIFGDMKSRRTCQTIFQNELESDPGQEIKVNESSKRIESKTARMLFNTHFHSRLQIAQQQEK